jgi:hypothetical protein
VTGTVPLKILVCSVDVRLCVVVVGVVGVVGDFMGQSLRFYSKILLQMHGMGTGIAMQMSKWGWGEELQCK